MDDLTPLERKIDLLLVWSLFVIILGKRLLFLDFGLNPEESKDYVSILRILDGEVPYRDFLWIYGYLGLYVNAFFIKLLGISDLWVPRLVVSIFFSTSTFFSYRICRRFLKPFWAFVVVLLAFSGLVAREHTYGHIFALFGVTISLWSALNFLNRGRGKDLSLAGLGVSFAIVSKPLPIGFLAGIVLVIFVIYKNVLEKQDLAAPLTKVLVGILGLPVLGGLYFLTQGAFVQLLASNFPMFSGNTAPPSIYFFVPTFIPWEIFSANEVSQCINLLNSYLQQNFRWWLIVIVFGFGCVYSIPRLFRNPRDERALQVLLVTAFIPVFDIQRILLSGVNQYISMFPTYLMLAYLGMESSTRNGVKWGVQVLLLFFLGVFFLYSPLIYGFQYLTKGLPLNLSHAKAIRLLPYTHEIYSETVRFIQENTEKEDKIVFAEYNSFFYVLSGRPSLYPDNWYLFAGTTFHPYRQRLINPVVEKLSLEKNIVKRIERERTRLVLVPTQFLSPDKIQESHLLRYLIDQWDHCKTIGDLSKRSSFESNYNITIFCPRHDEV